MANTSLTSLLDTSPRWLSMTLIFSATAIVFAGINFLFSPFLEFTITPLTMILHLVFAVCISSWILNLKIKIISSDKKPLLALGAVVAIGSFWSSIQQWLAYVENGTVNDLMLVVGTMLMDVIGGVLTYVLYTVNMTRVSRGQKLLAK